MEHTASEPYILAAATDPKRWRHLRKVISLGSFVRKDAALLWRAMEQYWKTADRWLVTTYKVVVTNLAETPDEAKAALELLAEVQKLRASDQLDTILQSHLKHVEIRRILTEGINEFGAGQFDPAVMAQRLTALDQVLGKKPAFVTNVEREIKRAAAADRFPTGWEGLDARLNGGLYVGEVGVIIGPSFRGKTWAMNALAMQALESGVPVSIQSFDLSREMFLIRLLQARARESRAWVEGHPRAAAKRWAGLPPVELQDYAARAGGVEDIRHSVNRFVDEVGKVPLLFVDPLDKVRQHGEKTRHTLRWVVEQLREIAQSTQSAVWCTTWSGRHTYDQDRDVTMSDVSESIGKVEEADVVISLNASATETAAGLMRWGLEKARERELHGVEYIWMVALMECQRFEYQPDAQERIFTL